MAPKSKRILIKLVSQANTGHWYVKSKNPTNSPLPLVLKKYDPVVRRHVLYHEQKLVSGKKR